MASRRGYLIAFLVLAGAIGALGCAGTGPTSGSQPADADLASDPASMRRLHLDLVARLVERGQARAALAHLDAVAEEPEQAGAAFLRAESLRQLGRDEEATELYLDLSGGPMRAAAYRGLGLVSARQGRFAEAVESLEQGRDADPTNPRIRNDLGYALLRAQRYAEARAELGAAVELSGEQTPPVRNLVLLLYVVREHEEAERWVRRAGLDARAVESIRAQADRLRREDRGLPVSDGGERDGELG